MNIKSKTIVILIVMLLLPSFMVPSVSAAPYVGYNYSYWEKAEPSPVPYVPELVIDGIGEEYGTFSSPEDLYVRDNLIYILDTGNNRIVILNDQYELVSEITEFNNNGQIDNFNSPFGIFVTEEHHIYVADTNNRRIVHLDGNGEFIREIGPPEADVIREGLEYRPIKLSVDRAKRIYVIGRGIYDGIIEFDSDGVFTGYTGAPRVSFNPIDLFWRAIATREQRARMSLFIPIEFNSIDVDEEGFLYTTNVENSSTPVQRLNATGADIIRREGYHPIIGDIDYPFRGPQSGRTTFVDITANEYGMYSVLDSRRGRIFTYDEDGNLLYIFGSLGDQVGTFATPVAVETLGDKILTLDKGNHNLVVFKPTAFGENVNKAVMYYNRGDEEQSAAYWREVLRLDANYEVAYVGIGKSLLADGQNEEALSYFENGNSRLYYSKAFKRHRQEVLRENFGTIMTTIVLVGVAYIGFRTVKSVRRRRAESHVERAS